MVPRATLVAILALIGLRSAAGAEPRPAARFVRGVNLNGPALVLDGQSWQAGDSANVRTQGGAFENQQIVLRPVVDAQRARMIRSSRWGREIDVDLLNLPPGDYQVCLYVWEDNDSTTFSVLVNDRTVVDRFASGPGGSWKRLGPWPAKAADGTIRLSARGGDANLSGVEIWSGAGEVPNPLAPAFVAEPSAEQLAFFESKVRPVLVEHCYACHSQDSKELGGGLLLDSRPGIVKGGESQHPAIVPGDVEASLLIRAVRHRDPDLKMPPEEKLSDLAIASLEEWVKMRAPDPRTEDTVKQAEVKSAIDWDKARDFWSLKPLSAPMVPAVKDRDWPASDIDRFVLARLEAAGLRPAGDATKSVLLRRVTYDLIGLAPTPEEQAAFESDSSPQAFARVVDRLLASPRYGERWGRHWLDVVRYADTAGDNSDFPIPQMYLYRNWVIDAVNRDLPYDQFVREQLAGDLLPGGTPDERRQRTIATGYLANSRRFGSRVDDYPWHLTIEDTLDNLGRTFLATTINCARCHNHKFDPVTVEDYYGLYGIFRSTRYPWPGIELEQRQRDLVPLAAADEVERVTKEHRAQGEELKSQLRALEKARDEAQGEAKRPLERQAAEAKQKLERHNRQPLGFEQAYAVADAAKPADAAIQLKGDPAKSGPLAPRKFLTVLGGARLAEGDPSSGRLQLAEWITAPGNPLTPRVMANRIWLHHLGKGLVPTPNDFGRQGKAPTHPELLDHLAAQFVRSGWSMKALHRQIVLSRTYRTASTRDEAALRIDPNNELLASYPRRRLDAEALRDTLLQLSGRLDLSVGEAHPFPKQTEWKFTQHNPFKAVYETNRRSVYLMTQRIQRHPYLAVFDGADPSASTPMRLASTTPLQALFLLNAPFVHDQAAGLAERLLRERAEAPARIELAYRLLFGRAPAADESQAALEFLGQIRGQAPRETPADQLESLSWQALVRTWFRLNEFAYLD